LKGIQPEAPFHAKQPGMIGGQINPKEVKNRAKNEEAVKNRLKNPTPALNPTRYRQRHGNDGNNRVGRLALGRHQISIRLGETGNDWLNMGLFSVAPQLAL
jgi:hypothetical protein